MSTPPLNKPGKLAQIVVFAAAAGIPTAYGYGCVFVQNHPPVATSISHKLDQVLRFIPNISPEDSTKADWIPWMGASAPVRNTPKRGMG
ncbi:MAG TPA: hypothetical protein VGZ00_12295 [Candidatus Baltobacteraceae bacterium]|jgi:hypothetical protein|nr:hypothetical protein [Candidatus Baltobacteraceae bacterium]